MLTIKATAGRIITRKAFGRSGPTGRTDRSMVSCLGRQFLPARWLSIRLRDPGDAFTPGGGCLFSIHPKMRPNRRWNRIIPDLKADIAHYRHHSGVTTACQLTPDYRLGLSELGWGGCSTRSPACETESLTRTAAFLRPTHMRARGAEAIRRAGSSTRSPRPGWPPPNPMPCGARQHLLAMAQVNRNILSGARNPARSLPMDRLVSPRLACTL